MKIYFRTDGNLLEYSLDEFNKDESYKYDKSKPTLVYCDLSASYNIASRYFVREYIKPLDLNLRLALETKASLKLSGTTVTYNTFKVLLNVIN